MKIAIDGRVLFLSKIKGVGRYLQYLLKEFDRMNSQIDFYLLRNPRTTEADKVEQYEHIQTIDLPAPSDFIWEQFTVSRFIRKNKVDVYHGPANTVGALTRCVKIVTLHDAMSHRFARSWGMLENAYWNIVQRNAYRSVDGFITPTQFAKRQLIDELQIPDEKIKVVYHGISNKFGRAPDSAVNEWRSKYGLDKPYIFVAGARLPRKNIATVLKAFELLGSRVEKYDLVITGVIGLDIVEKILDAMKMKHCVKLLPHLDEGELISAYSGAELFVFPSLEETFGFPPLEAMACGAPVVASNASCIPEVVGDGAELVDCRNPKPLSETIFKILGSNAAKNDLRERGWKRAECFSWKRACDETLKIYESSWKK